MIWCDVILYYIGYNVNVMRCDAMGCHVIFLNFSSYSTTEGRKDRQTEGRMVGWMYGWLAGRTDGIVKLLVCTFFTCFGKVYQVIFCLFQGKLHFTHVTWMKNTCEVWTNFNSLQFVFKTLFFETTTTQCQGNCWSTQKMRQVFFKVLFFLFSKVFEILWERLSVGLFFFFGWTKI